MKAYLKAAFFAGVAALFSAQAPAQVTDDVQKKCAGTAAQGVTPDMVIEACSAIIREGGSPALTSAAYYNRGNAEFDKKDFEKAVEDYTHAIGLRDNYASAMRNRGIAKLHLGDTAGGNADIAAAKAMPSN
ncbi:MAG TPA: tetratricopeptide repeat protein [Rhizomicrobium sp.]|nr:tetratricopeptide repeat protein [Rhizomicrobium sp.]